MTTPPNYCEARAKITLNIMQFRVMHTADAAKAGWSQRKTQESQRQLGLHDAACPLCSEVVIQ